MKLSKFLERFLMRNLVNMFKWKNIWRQRCT